MRKLSTLVLVFLAACAPSVSSTVRTTPHSVTFERRVARHDIVHSSDELVARGYSHAASADWFSAPYYVLIDEQGESCIVSAAVYARVSDLDLFECSWRRGGR